MTQQLAFLKPSGVGGSVVNARESNMAAPPTSRVKWAAPGARQQQQRRRVAFSSGRAGVPRRPGGKTTRVDGSRSARRRRLIRARQRRPLTAARRPTSESLSHAPRSAVDPAGGTTALRKRETLRRSGDRANLFSSAFASRANFFPSEREGIRAIFANCAPHVPSEGHPATLAAPAGGRGRGAGTSPVSGTRAARGRWADGPPRSRPLFSFVLKLRSWASESNVRGPDVDDAASLSQRRSPSVLFAPCASLFYY